jgi:HEAT repeats
MSPAAGSEQLAELIRALALAWKNLAAYPPGHPALVGSLDMVHRRLDELRGPAGEVVFGIAAGGLLYGEEKFDSVPAQKFAHALYTRGVAILRFGSATTASDLDTFLRLLGVGDSAGEGQPIWEALTAAGVATINLQPVDYSAIRVTADLDSGPQRTEQPRSLWEEILRALLAGRDISATPAALSRYVNSVDELSAMILRYVASAGQEPDAEFDPKATFGVNRLIAVPQGDQTPEAVMERVADAIGDFVARSSGLKRQLAVQQVLHLLRTLPDTLRTAVLRSVLRVLATDESAGAALREFTAELTRDDILEALAYLSTLPKLSTHAIKFLDMLAPMEKKPVQPVEVSPAVLADLVHLFGDEDIDRFNPPDHQALLDQISVNIPALPAGQQNPIDQLGDLVETVADDAVNRQLEQTLLDLLTAHGTERQTAALLSRVEALFRTQLTAGQYADAVQSIERMQEIALLTESDELRTSVHEWYGRLANAETMGTLVDTILSSVADKSSAIQRLTDALGTNATRSLLEALAEEGNRSRRRRLFDFLSSFGSIIVPEVKRFLNDSRWYVQRNAVVLLRAVNDRTSLPEIRRFTHHADLRVRLEALKSLLTLDRNVPRALLDEAINDSDPKVAEAAVTLIGNYGVKEAIGPLLTILNKRDVFASYESLRVLAIKALGEIGDPIALISMQQFFSDSILPWPTMEERRAAYESLIGYPIETRKAFVDKGLKSRDAGVRKICRQMAGRDDR